MRKKDKNTLLITTLICACTVIIYGIFCHFYLAERILTQDFYVGLFLSVSYTHLTLPTIA